mmetsp:Transcript_47818/g.154075  ORF Transcript_47818/g.154075 Transcript_47818/m.154075 type:complete len:211 (+) Transcript_47818:1799-2431(+)
MRHLELEHPSDAAWHSASVHREHSTSDVGGSSDHQGGRWKCHPLEHDHDGVHRRRGGEPSGGLPRRHARHHPDHRAGGRRAGEGAARAREGGGADCQAGRLRKEVRRGGVLDWAGCYVSPAQSHDLARRLAPAPRRLLARFGFCAHGARVLQEVCRERLNRQRLEWQRAECYHCTARCARPQYLGFRKWLALLPRQGPHPLGKEEVGGRW